jgi:hypothetical protein
MFKSEFSSPDLSAPDYIIDAGNYSHKGNFTVYFDYDDQIISLSKRVALAFENIPLLGIDFVKDAKTSKLYVLEVNAGGNTWHFSSNLWAARRQANPDLTRAMKEQFGAFDIAAKVLVENVRSRAE